MCDAIDLDLDDPCAGSSLTPWPPVVTPCAGADLPASQPQRKWGKAFVGAVSRDGGANLPASSLPRRWGRVLPGAVPRDGLAAGDVDIPAKRLEGSGWFLVQGDDALSSVRLRQAKDAWKQTIAKCSAQSPFEDVEFPAVPRCLYGRDDAEQMPKQGPDGDQAPRCRCGTASTKSLVKKEGPTKGRPYWHCGTRRCGYFLWADAEMRRRGRMWWQRFPEFVVVSDYGFRAEDLRQGGVGDCWFLSALAVVAERPDLILRLLGGETARNSAGCYNIQLFLDGEWQASCVDDRLPCTDQQRRPDGSGIAYSRADGQQLWTALIEKAYAKAHGSYRAISGGEIAEALLDLTGCPTESIDFDEHGFNPQELWARLLSFKQKSFPMGCATAGNPELREVGLCGSHAYSILDVREIFDARFVGRPLGYGGAEEDGLVRLIRIRNPHGVGEWNGEWSDKSAEWTEGLAAELGRTGVDDGTFWMDYTHFLMAFQVVDVCMAHQGWHAWSFDNAFCVKSATSRICKYMYDISCDAATELYAMALQPTKRGAWCRDDRKKSYKPGDISLLLIRRGAKGEQDEIIGGNFFSADLMARRSVHAQLKDPQSTYLLVAFCFGAGPVAHGGEERGRGPFKVRLFASRPVNIRPTEPQQAPVLASTALAALHTACLVLTPAPGRRFRRQVRRLGDGITLFQVTGEGAVLLLAANEQSNGVVFIKLTADVKVMTARSSDGLLTTASSSAEDAAETQPVVCYNCGRPGHISRDCTNPKQRGIRTPWRYPAKWRKVSTECRVPAGCQRLAMVLIGNGMQADLGSISAEASCEPSAAQGLGRWMQSFADGFSSQGPATDAFASRPLMPDLVHVATRDAKPVWAPALDDVLDAAKQVSLDWLRAQEEQQLAAALHASVTGDAPIHDGALTALLNGHAPEEEDQLAKAIAASVAEISSQPCAKGDLKSSDIRANADEDLAKALAASRATPEADDDADLRAALLLSVAPSAQGKPCPVVGTEVIDSDSDFEVVASSSIAPQPKRARVRREFEGDVEDASVQTHAAQNGGKISFY